MLYLYNPVIGGSQLNMFDFLYIFEDLLTLQNLQKAAPLPFSQICVCIENDRQLWKEIDWPWCIDESFIVYMQELQCTLFLDIWRDVYWLVHTLYTKIAEFT